MRGLIMESRHFMRPLMRFRQLGAAAGLALAAAACNNFLDVKPIAELPKEQALTGPTSARAAVVGMYDGLQDETGGNFYSGDYLFFRDVSSDDVDWTGTFTTFADAEDNNLRPDNGDVRGMWNSMYTTVARANFVIEQLPGVSGIDADEKNQLLGEAYFVRALVFHDLLITWGGRNPGDPGIPLPLTPAADASAGAKATRATVAQSYAQILSDLDAAEAKMDPSVDDVTRGTLGAVRALRARVLLYEKNYAAAEAAATVVEGMGYALAPNYADLFGADLPADDRESIFRLTFTAQDFSSEGYYYLGRTENEPSAALAKAYQPSLDTATTIPGGAPNPNWLKNWAPVDRRAQATIVVDPAGDFCGLPICGTKYPTTVGAEDIHVIRFAEVVLTRAEAMARQGGGKLLGAVTEVNRIRRRAGLDTLVFGVDITTQQQVIDEVLLQRRLELAMEGHRWGDLVRTGAIDAYLTSKGAGTYQALYPIPSREISVAPGLVQNPGYR
jgi:starch-binding outer membrane protein, SusD/RagB family